MQNKCLAVLALALGVSAKAPVTLKADKVQTRNAKYDAIRVSNHMKKLLAHPSLPAEHKAKLDEEVKRLTTSSSDETIDSWFGAPKTLDWIVDVYFDEGDDATAYPVILDSGSSNLAIAIESCTNCEEASTTLDPTEVDDMCIEVTYGSGSWSGVEVSESYVALSSDLSTMTTYAGITDQDDFFSGGSSYVGILGMAYQGIANSYYSDECSSSSKASGRSARATASSSARAGAASSAEGGRRSEAQSSATRAGRGLADLDTDGDAGTVATTTSVTETLATPLLTAMAASGAVDDAAFAVAMCGDSATVSIGGVDSDLIDGDVSYADVQETFGEFYGYYLIYTTGVAVDGTSVTVDDINLYGGLVVDTGTTLHYLPTATVKAIETEVKTTVSDTIASTSFFNWEACLTADDIADFPDITYTFATSDADDATSFDVVLAPEHYLLDYDSCYYWGFEESSLGIFGNIGMKDKVMVFDVTNNKIGIATGVCGSTDSLYKSASQMAAEVAAEISKRSPSELAVGVASAMAVVGAVLASAFVVFTKLAKKAEGAAEEEEKSLLPPL